MYGMEIGGFTVSGPQGVVFGGGASNTRSKVSDGFDRYMEAHAPPWEHDPYTATERRVFVWSGRPVRVLLRAGGEWVQGKVLELSQYNTGPFCPCTFWQIKVQYADAAAARAAEAAEAREAADTADTAGAAGARAVVHELCRCDVLKGGTIGSDCGRRVSFQFLAPPTPPPPATPCKPEPPSLPAVGGGLEAARQKAKARAPKDVRGVHRSLVELVPDGWKRTRPAKELEPLLEALLTWPVELLCNDYVMKAVMEESPQRLPLCLAFLAALPEREHELQPFLRMSGIDEMAPRDFVLKRTNNLCVRIAEDLETAREFEAAIHYYDRACRLSAEGVCGCPRELHAIDLNNLALCQKRDARLEDALRTYDASVAADPNGSSAPRNRERVLAEMAEWNGTAGEYNAHLPISKGDMVAINGLLSRTDLNGQVGVVLDFADGTYGVRVHDGGEAGAVRVKAESLRRVS